MKEFRFHSPDPFVQNAGNSQSFNRYSYAFNNPLIYTDPSGYVAYGNSSITYSVSETERVNNAYYYLDYWDKLYGRGYYGLVGPSISALGVCKWIRGGGGNGVIGFSIDGRTIKYNGVKYTYSESMGAYGYWSESAKPYGISMKIIEIKNGNSMTTFQLSGVETILTWVTLGRVLAYDKSQVPTEDGYFTGYWTSKPSGEYGPATSFGEDANLISIQGRAFVGGGFGIQGSYGFVKGEKEFVNGSIIAGVGVDISASVDANFMWYTGRDNPNAASTYGPVGFVDVGLGILSLSVYGDIGRDPEDNVVKIGKHWIGFSVGLSVSPLPATLNFGTIITSNPLIIK